MFDLIDFDNNLASMAPVFEARNQYFITNQASRKNRKLVFYINNEMTQKDKTTFSEPCRICNTSSGISYMKDRLEQESVENILTWLHYPHAAYPPRDPDLESNEIFQPAVELFHEKKLSDQ